VARTRRVAAPPFDGTRSDRGALDRGAVIAYVVLAFGLSWAWWIPLALGGHTVSAGVGWPTHLPGLLGPAAAATIVTAWCDGRAGVADLASRVVRWRVAWWVYALIAATAALLVVPFVVGRSGDAAELGRYSGAPEAGVWLVPYVLVVNGFGEEIGWRGFLADRLLRTESMGRTAVVVWAIWTLWHLPLFWVNDHFREFGVSGTIGWLVGIGFGSLFLTWLYDSARRSILVVALWHTTYNFTTATEASAGLSAALATMMVIVVAVVIARRPATWRRPGASAASG
jgi:membrane protease YdiL (CAAX protease family)